MNRTRFANTLEYDELQTLLNDYYPKAPFTIECCKTFADLHKPFTHEEYIIICDNRGLYNQDKQWKQMSETEQEKYKLYLVIHSLNNKPITKHRILTEMIANKHYQHKKHKNDDHKFLEGFYNYDGVVFNCNWGS